MVERLPIQLDARRCVSFSPTSAKVKCTRSVRLKRIHRSFACNSNFPLPLILERISYLHRSNCLFRAMDISNVESNCKMLPCSCSCSCPYHSDTFRADKRDKSLKNMLMAEEDFKAIGR